MPPRTFLASAGPIAAQPNVPFDMPEVRGGTVWRGNYRVRLPAAWPSAQRRRYVRAHQRTSLAIAGSAAGLYAAFILLVTFGKPLAGRMLIPGLSVEFLFAVMIMTVAWLATGFYTLWSERIERRRARWVYAVPRRAESDR